jgi:caffeoyl-CoA O-methyltransferase
MDNTLFEQVDAYISDLLAPEDAALQAVTETLKQNGIPDASVAPVQGKFLQVMAAACRAERILELGTLGAYSTIWLGRTLPENGRIVSVEFDAQHAEIARQNIERAGLVSKTDIRTGKALDILPQLEAENAGPFDLVFIDADKPPYQEYFQWAIRLGRPGTIIIADNVIRNGKVLDADSADEKVQGVRRLNAWLKECDEVTATIVQNVGAKEYDGMVVAVVK